MTNKKSSWHLAFEAALTATIVILIKTLSEIL